ncbi:MAG: LysR family transcriptional regulator [Lachnospiraceae bacterium]|nr:LysR family transcriptional regulator [Lachnospiraceae bacterium]
MSVSYDYYRIFYYVATYHSFNKAASVLSNSQPNISRSIAALESQLGCRLFNRFSTGVTLTEAGDDLFRHVEPAFRLLRTAENELQFSGELSTGILTVGISTGITRGVIEKFLIPTLNQFHDKFPDVRLQIFHDSTTVLTSQVNHDLVDIAFITVDQNTNTAKKNNENRILYSYNDIAVAGPRYADILNKKISITDLARFPLIGLGKNTDTFKYYKDIFSNYGLEYRPSIETIATGQILGYVAGNFGIGFIHPKDAEQGLGDKSLVKVKLKEKLPKRNIALIKNNKDKKSSAVFEQMLNEHLNDE